MITIANSLELAEHIEKGQLTPALGEKIREDLELAKEQYEAEEEELGLTVILQGNETEADFESLGLESGHLGAWGALCEWVDFLKLAEEKYFYFCIVMNNSFAIVFYSPVGNYSQTNPQLEEWLQKEGGEK